MDEFEQLVRKMEAFQSYVSEEMWYTYIAPKDNDSFYKFLASIYHSSATHSLYQRLSNPEVVRKMLQDLGLYENTELEIYVATNDRFAVQWKNKTLEEFIKEKEIDFQY